MSSISKGKKISELIQDDIVSGEEKIPISDNGITKFITVKQLLSSVSNTDTEHESNQLSYISQNILDIQQLQNRLNTITGDSINTVVGELWESYSE